jgi:hypothetical protein
MGLKLTPAHRVEVGVLRPFSLINVLPKLMKKIHQLQVKKPIV